MTLTASFPGTVVAVIQNVLEISLFTVLIELKGVVLEVEPIVLLLFVKGADWHVVGSFPMRMGCFRRAACVRNARSHLLQFSQIVDS